jgi:hypothetical protein
VISKSFVNVMSALSLRTDETANDLFKRLCHSENFNFQLDPRGSKTKQFSFGDLVDFKCQPLEVHNATLSLVNQFADQFPDGLVVHMSSSTNFFATLKALESTLSPNLQTMLESGAIRSLSVHHIVQLVSVLEILTASTHGKKVLLILESLGNVLRSVKVIYGF